MYHCAFHIHNGLRQGDALSPLLFNFALEYVVKKLEETREGLSLNGQIQMLSYADDIDIIGDNKETVEKNTEILIECSTGLSVSTARS